MQMKQCAIASDPFLFTETFSIPNQIPDAAATTKMNNNAPHFNIFIIYVEVKSSI